jgi:hypothetical protein
MVMSDEGLTYKFFDTSLTEVMLKDISQRPLLALVKCAKRRTQPCLLC